MVTAQDPNLFKTAWSHNYLVGSELIVNGLGVIYSVNARPFASPLETGAPTDVDEDGQLDFDEIEYEGVGDDLILDSFLAALGSHLTLINLTGGKDFVANVQFDVFNDNEIPLSATTQLRCWMDAPLREISLVFDQTFLAANAGNDTTELDINCDGVNEFETGWATIRGMNASSSAQSIPNPAMLGAITNGLFFVSGRLLWESETQSLNGDFFKTGTVDPEN